jgi:hypothetical protein
MELTAAFKINCEVGRCRIWGSHSIGYEEFCFLGYNAVQSVES